jgi:hypothetical protein
MEDARAALVLSLTVMEAIINFLLNIYRSAFLCFVELVVRGGLSLLITAVQDVSLTAWSILTPSKLIPYTDQYLHHRCP